MKKRTIPLIVLTLIVAGYKITESSEARDPGEEYYAYDGDTPQRITEKAIELLINEGNLNKVQIEELDKYRKQIKEGSRNEDFVSFEDLSIWRPDNHCYDPRTGEGKKGHASALDWAKGAKDPRGDDIRQAC
jgi:hypothetical protein